MVPPFHVSESKYFNELDVNVAGSSPVRPAIGSRNHYYFFGHFGPGVRGAALCTGNRVDTGRAGCLDKFVWSGQGRADLTPPTEPRYGTGAQQEMGRDERHRGPDGSAANG